MPSAPDRSLPPSLLELQRDANRLASQIQATRARNLAPTILRPGSRGWRILQFPITVRKFERVFFCQGEGWLVRWGRALWCAGLTIGPTTGDR